MSRYDTLPNILKRLRHYVRLALRRSFCRHRRVIVRVSPSTWGTIESDGHIYTTYVICERCGESLFGHLVDDGSGSKRREIPADERRAERYANALTSIPEKYAQDVRHAHRNEPFAYLLPYDRTL